MSIEKKIIERAKKLNRTIVLPEAKYSTRVLTAGVKAAKLGIAKIIFVVSNSEGEANHKQYENKNLVVINQKTYINNKIMIKTLLEKRRAKGMTEEEAKRLVETDSIIFGTMLVECGFADGMVAGAETTSADVLRPALQIIKAKKDVSVVSSAFIMSGKTIPNEHGCYLFADCALNLDPTPEELADIACATAASAREICGFEPIVALLSYITFGGAKTDKESDKICQTRRILKERNVDFVFDGQMQVDAALNPTVAEKKAPHSKVAGKANCLIFPNIMAGNIGYKLFQAGGAGKINAVGPFTQGLNKPINDLSRGCTVDEIIISIALTALQS